MASCLISLGSNLGDPEGNLRAALARISKLPNIQLICAGTFHATKAIGGPAEQPAFLNAAAAIETSLTPEELLREMQSVEQTLGRVRLERWGPRTLDIDLLLYDDLELWQTELVIPHPRLVVRRFMLEPAAEIAADWIYPINGWTVKRLLTNLNEARRVAIYAPRQEVAQALATALRAQNSTWEFASLGNVAMLPPQRARFAVVLAPPNETDSLAEIDKLCRTAPMCPALWIRDSTMQDAVAEILAACQASE